MTDRTHDADDILDRTAAEIASRQLDAESVNRITDRVWQRLATDRQSHQQLRTCDDFQREIPAYVAGSLSEARALLVGDHTRGCVTCRRALMAERGELRETGPTRVAADRSRTTRVLLRVAAAAILILTGVASVRLVGNFMADRNLRATVASVDGSLQLVSADGTADLDQGRGILARQVVRTAKESGAMIRLADGSMVEMNERSEIALRASRRGTTIDLQRGNIIVHAADQHGGRLYVATADCEVAVKGTIFSVNHGLKGSRVSVIEGEVVVREGSNRAVLLPGEQITTSERLRHVPLEQEFAWSRDAEVHRQLLRELTSLQKAVAAAVDQAPPRTSTFLLDLAPADTFVYAAMPNITDGLADARAAFEERLAASPVLNEWWQTQVVATGVEGEIDQMLDRLQPLGEAFGEEAVVAVPQSVMEGHATPLFMAELDDADSFRAELEALVEKANDEAGGAAEVVIVGDPRTAPPTAADVIVWVAGELFAASSDLDSLKALADRVDDPAARTFAGTRLHTRLAESYANGVSWLLGADVNAVISGALATMPADEAAVAERLGVLDITTLIVERHRDGDWYATNAELLFSARRKGIMAWLAAPAPMGSLEFVSPQAYVAAAAVTRDPAEMFDELLAILAERDPDAWAELQLSQEQIGIDLRDGLAATLGGEATFALDGPMLPVPSWKLIVEVYDPATLVHTLGSAIAQLNTELAGQGEAPVQLDEESSSGRTYYTLRREGLDGLAVFTAIDGYMVFGPNRAVVDQAIAQRASGATLARSDAFRAMLPDNGYTDCSAIVYRDLGGLMSAVPAELMEQFELAGAVGDGLSTGLVCVFGGDDRITISATGGSLLGIGSVLGLATAIHDEAATVAIVDTTGEGDAAGNPNAVSSRG
jgi:hypothetical protein